MQTVNHSRHSRRAAILLMVLALSMPLLARQDDEKKGNQKADKTAARKAKATDLPAVIWRDPGDVSALNLFYGPGGKEHAPNPDAKYTFVKEDSAGTSPKFDIDDDQGNKWRVKLGQEPKSETAATRLLWAAGYFADDDYYLEELHVQGLPKLKRGGEFVKDGVVHKARLENRDRGKKLGNWKWESNPFVGQKEFNGLRVMMAFTNNWDLKVINNTIFKRHGEQVYVVTDVGATFGNTGNSLTRSKSEVKDYVESKFIAKANPDSVDFVMHSRPFILSIVNLPNYLKRTSYEHITKGIPRADAKWLGQRLGMLSEDQIRDCFKAAGYSPEDIESYTKTVQKRIAELNAL